MFIDRWLADNRHFRTGKIHFRDELLACAFATLARVKDPSSGQWTPVPSAKLPSNMLDSGCTSGCTPVSARNSASALN